MWVITTVLTFLQQYLTWDPKLSTCISSEHSLNSHDLYSGLKIATNMVANVTDIFSLATKNSGLEATFETRFRFQRFKENESWKFSFLGVTGLIIIHTLSLGTMRIAVKHWMAAAMTASEESSNAHLRRNRTPASRRTDTILSSRCS